MIKSILSFNDQQSKKKKGKFNSEKMSKNCKLVIVLTPLY